jgi:hypothetical protein
LVQFILDHQCQCFWYAGLTGMLLSKAICCATFRIEIVDNIFE